MCLSSKRLLESSQGCIRPIQYVPHTFCLGLQGQVCLLWLVSYTIYGTQFRPIGFVRLILYKLGAHPGPRFSGKPISVILLYFGIRLVQVGVMVSQGLVDCLLLGLVRGTLVYDQLRSALEFLGLIMHGKVLEIPNSYFQWKKT